MAKLAPSRPAPFLRGELVKACHMHGDDVCMKGSVGVRDVKQWDTGTVCGCEALSRTVPAPQGGLVMAKLAPSRPGPFLRGELVKACHMHGDNVCKIRSVDVCEAPSGIAPAPWGGLVMATGAPSGTVPFPWGGLFKAWWLQGPGFWASPMRAPSCQLWLWTSRLGAGGAAGAGGVPE